MNQNTESSLNIRVANNGYIVSNGKDYCGPSTENVFETFESLEKWLKSALATPKDSKPAK